MNDKQQDDYQRVEYEVQQTLQCLDNIGTVRCSPGFFARLVARIEAIESGKVKLPDFFSIKSVLRPAFIVLLIMINLISALVIIQSDPTSQDNRKETITEIAGDYYPDSSAYETEIYAHNFETD